MRIGIDLGGTKIEGIVLSPEGIVLHRERVSTPRERYQDIVNVIGDLFFMLESLAGEPCSLGIGTPGSLNPDGQIRNSNTIELNGRHLVDDLEAIINRPIRIANDANCFTLSEATDGAAAGYATVFGVILGTGVGGGLVVNGQLLSGCNAIAGEWGHNPLPWSLADEIPGPSCYCGKRGCIETYLSGPGLAHDYQLRSGKIKSAIDIVTDATHEPAAEAALLRYENRLARALAHVINIVDPHVIVLGGGLSQINRLYQNVSTLLPNFVFSDVHNTEIRPPRHGDSSGVRGAAWLW